MHALRLRDRTLPLGARTYVMGIVNVTPDSFSDGGRHATPDAAIAHALRLVDEGADLLDIGGESTRPGATPVPAEEEARRVVPVIRELARRTDAILSVDTMKSAVAREALEAGAHLVNDVSGLQVSPDLPQIVAKHGAGLVLMHMKGNPQTMQQNPHYDDVVGEVLVFLHRQAQAAIAAGVPRDSILLDPGIGFGKNSDHNRTLLQHLDALKGLGHPLLLGVSRKSFIGRLTARGDHVPPPTDRLEGSLAAAVAGIAKGVDVVRAHDVRETVRAARVADWILREA